MSLWKSAIVFRRAEAHYQRHFRDYLQQPSIPLDDDRFWTLLGQLLCAAAAVRLQEPIAGRYFAAMTCERFLRQAFASPTPSTLAGSPEFTDMLLFDKSWHQRQQQLHRALVPLASDEGPEVCERWSDALPLAGRRVTEAVLAGNPRERTELESLIRATNPARAWVSELIWQSRGCWRSALHEATQSFFAACADQEAQDIDWLESSW